MRRHDLNTIAKIEQAISKKYGEETIVNPRSLWTKEKEIDYLEQIKIIYKRSFKISQDTEKINKDGFFISKKLLTKDEDRICPACFEYSFDLKDDLYMSKYDCCWKCYMHFVEGREERWMNIDKRVEFLANFYKGKDNG
tara:strand:- start:4667 stop:5083 length:417 start_codon:yes stop_codon:yes gene_type:complete